mgnify:CR=1 FL=1
MIKKSIILIIASLLLSSCQTVNYEKYSLLTVNDEKFIPPTKSKYIRGVSKEQWTIINKIGDPLNCEERINKLNKIQKGNIITSQEYSNDHFVIHTSLRENKVTILTEGTYNLINPIVVPENKYLIGEGDVIINANFAEMGIYNSGNIKNLTIQNAKTYGVFLGNFSTTYNVLVTGTGINHPLNSNGNGVHSNGTASHSNCVVSVETSFGYNEQGSSNITIKGGNADGFTVKYGAHDITFIDTHAHHNSDDGYDFWKGGAEKPTTTYQPTIRIFYSSANHNGKNPFTPNGDGNGFKFGSWDQYQRNRGRDKGDRLIYGSVACYNLEKGFDRNRSRMKIITQNLNSTGNIVNYKDVPVPFNKNNLDKSALTCEMFPK